MFAELCFHFSGADVLSTGYFLLITYCALNLFALAFSGQHTVNGAEGYKQDNLENAVSRAGA